MLPLYYKGASFFVHKAKWFGLKAPTRWILAATESPYSQHEVMSRVIWLYVHIAYLLLLKVVFLFVLQQGLSPNFVLDSLNLPCGQFLKMGTPIFISIIYIYTV